MKPWRSKAYLAAANGVPCVYCDSVGTTVACHIRLKGFCGTGQKPHDWMVIDACADCHAKLDGRQQPSWQGDYERLLIGFCRTIERRYESKN